MLHTAQLETTQIGIRRTKFVYYEKIATYEATTNILNSILYLYRLLLLLLLLGKREMRANARSLLYFHTILLPFAFRLVGAVEASTRDVLNTDGHTQHTHISFILYYNSSSIGSGSSLSAKFCFRWT